MMISNTWLQRLLAAMTLVAISGCAGQSNNASQMTTSLAPAPAAAATTAADGSRAAAAGDIPDTQAFVTYSGPDYSVLVPEGWARTRRASTVSFTWNANAEAIVEGASADQERLLRTEFGAIGTIARRRAMIGGSPAAVATFTSRSRPDPVTGKSLPLANESYFFARGKRHVALVLSAPVGADNVDQWKKLAESLRWK